MMVMMMVSGGRCLSVLPCWSGGLMAGVSHHNSASLQGGRNSIALLDQLLSAVFLGVAL
jgi:hypothetical protein